MARPKGSIMGQRTWALVFRGYSANVVPCDARRKGGESIIQDLEAHHLGIHQHLARMFEVDGDAGAVDRLHLAVAPVGLGGVADPLSGFQRCGEGGTPGQAALLWHWHRSPPRPGTA